MKAKIVVLPGDGIGPEVTTAAIEVLRAVARRHGHEFAFDEHPIGGLAIDLYGDPLPPPTLVACKNADAVLLGAVGGPRWSDPKSKTRPEQGLLALRAGLGVYANLRPVSVHPRLAALSPLKNERLAGVDILFVRELTNVLETSRLWRETVTRVAQEFPDVALEHQLVDSMAMLLLTRPSAYDVVVTENLFGDILTDEAAALAGSLGLLPSASLGDGRAGLYEPIHGSAPDIAGKDAANPLGAILSAALLLRHSLGLEAEALAIEQAVDAVIERSELTADLGGKAGTRAVTAAVLAALDASASTQEAA